MTAQIAARIDFKLRIKLGDEIAMGPGKADLLDAIARTGSISAAARSMKMSYRRAWLLVEVMNRNFRAPLVRSAAGGQHGGGASVTEAGLQLLAQYRAMEAAALAAAQPHLDGIASALAPAANE